MKTTTTEAKTSTDKTPSSAPEALSIPTRKIVAVLWTIMAIVVLAGIGGQILRIVTGHEWVYGLVPRTNLDGEGNVPAYFSSMLLALGALFLTVIALSNYKTGHASRRYWAALALVFVWLSFDEAAAFHELFTEPLQASLNTGGIFFYAWVIPALGVLALFAVSFWRFFWRLPADTRRRFAVAGGVFVFGALGVELVESVVADTHGEGGLDYVLLVAFEEALEMAGAILFVDALLRHITTNLPQVKLHFTRK